MERTLSLILLLIAGIFLTTSCQKDDYNPFTDSDDEIIPIAVTFASVVQNGGASGTTSSTSLKLTFSTDPTTLTKGDITITGATKGELSGSGTNRTLTISDITVTNGATISVSIVNPIGYHKRVTKVSGCI